MIGGDNDLWYKALGASAGSIVALIFSPPASTKEFIRRAVVSIICGVIFARQTVHLLDLDHSNPDFTVENLIAGGAIAAGFSWFAIGAGLRILDIYNPNKRR